MKNLSVVLNIILLIAVAFLYFKVYNQKQPEAPLISGSGLPADAIVFINSDSLLEEYDYFNSLKKVLENKSDSIDLLLKSRAQSLEKEVMNYQERASGMTPDQRAETEERLMMKQQSLMQLKQNLLEDLSDSESDMNDSIHFNLSRYLRDYNKDKNHLYIFGYQRGSGILLAHDSLDITKQVLEGLNKK